MSRAVVRLSIGAERTVLAVGAAAGVGVLLAGPRPTGQIGVDAVLVIAAVTGCVWACASAPWWSLIVLSGVSALLADPLWAKIAGGVVFAAALYVGAKQRSQPVPRAVLVGASLVVMATAGDVWKFGISSLIGIGLAATAAVLGLLRRPGHDRRLALIGGAVAGGVVVLGVAGLAVAGVSARDDLSAGNAAVREGLRLAKEGDFDAAQAQFEAAAVRFGQADDAVTMPWAQVSRLVPIAAQHRTAADELAGSAAAATRTLDVEMRQLDLDALRIVDSRIDIEAVTALREPLLQVQQAIDGLDQAMVDSQNGWLVPPVDRAPDELAVEVDDQQVVSQAGARRARRRPGSARRRRRARLLRDVHHARGSARPGRLHGQLRRDHDRPGPHRDDRVRPPHRPQLGWRAPRKLVDAPRTGWPATARSVTRRAPTRSSVGSRGRTSRCRRTSRRPRRWWPSCTRRAAARRSTA